MSLLTQFYNSSGGGNFSSAGFTNFGTDPGAAFTGIWGTNQFKVGGPTMSAPPGAAGDFAPGFLGSTGGSVYYSKFLSGAQTLTSYYTAVPSLATIGNTTTTIVGDPNTPSDVYFINYSASMINGTALSMTNCKSITGFKWVALNNTAATSTNYFAAISADSSLTTFTNLYLGQFENGNSPANTQTVSITGATNLSTFSLLPFIFRTPTVGVGTVLKLEVKTAALSAASVNNVLVALQTTFTQQAGTTNCSGSSVDFSGGTSAGTSQLTAAGIAARNYLVSRGFTITLNA